MDVCNLSFILDEIQNNVTNVFDIISFRDCF